MSLASAVDPGWTAAQTAIVIVAVIVLIGGLITASVTYWLSQRAARRQRRAEAFASALAAVEDYAEMPYRIRRRRDDPEARYDLTEEVSKIQSKLAFHQALLQLESPDVGTAYSALVRAAKIQAGTQMKEAWQQPVLTTDAAMNLGVRYGRREIDAARANCIIAMRHALGQRAGDSPAPTANSDPPDRRTGSNTLTRLAPAGVEMAPETAHKAHSLDQREHPETTPHRRTHSSDC